MAPCRANHIKQEGSHGLPSCWLAVGLPDVTHGEAGVELPLVLDYGAVRDVVVVELVVGGKHADPVGV